MKRARTNSAPTGGGVESSGAAPPPARSELDAHLSALSLGYDARNDAADALARGSRELTTKSKRLIFDLLRLSGRSAAHVELETRAGRAQMQQLCANLRRSVPADQYWPLHRAFSPGLQECVEAALLYEYLVQGRLASMSELNDAWTWESSEGRPSSSAGASSSGSSSSGGLIREDDYLLGLCDLTGELMRLSLQPSYARSAERSGQLLDFARAIAGEFAAQTLPGAVYGSKLAVLSSSILKMEQNYFDLIVRCS